MWYLFNTCFTYSQFINLILNALPQHTCKGVKNILLFHTSMFQFYWSIFPISSPTPFGHVFFKTKFLNLKNSQVKWNFILCTLVSFVFPLIDTKTFLFYVCLWYHSTFSFLLQRYFLKMSWHRAPLMVKYLCSHYSVCNNYQNTERSTFGALNVPASIHWPLLFHSSSAYHLVLTLLWRPPLVTIDPKDLCTRSPVN